MKNRKRPLSALLAGALFASSSFALPPPEPAPGGEALELYRLDPALLVPEKGRPVIAGVVEQYAIELDPAAVASAPERFELDLPGGVRLEARRERTVVYDPTWMSWSGELRHLGLSAEAGGSGYVHLVYRGDRVTGVLNFGSEKYQIAGAAGGGHRLVRLGERRTPVCALETSPIRTTGGGFRAAPEPPSGPPLKTTVRIDVLAVYTDEFLSSPAAEAEVQDFIHTSVSIANDAFSRSGVNAYYDLVHVGPITGLQPPSPDRILSTLFWVDRFLEEPDSELAMLRETYGADMVALFVPRPDDGDDDFCGAAILPEWNDDRTDVIARPDSGVPAFSFDDRAYTVHRSGCGLSDFTFAHELGHNFGMRHDDEDDDPSADHLFPSGRGHKPVVDKVERASIVGCPCDGGPHEPDCEGNIAAGVCDRIPHFSDPNITYMGVDTGTSTRNNAHVARSQVFSYSLFRASACNVPPASGTWVVSENCTLEGTATAPGDVVVQNGATFTISNGAFLNVNFASHHLLVRDGSRVIVKNGGKID